MCARARLELQRRLTSSDARSRLRGHVRAAPNEPRGACDSYSPSGPQQLPVAAGAAETGGGGGGDDGDGGGSHGGCWSGGCGDAGGCGSGDEGSGGGNGGG